MSNKTENWFSRRYPTAEQHMAAVQAKQEAEADYFRRMDERVKARAKRSPSQQLAMLDQRLGKGKGAKRERARLLAQIEGGE